MGHHAIQALVSGAGGGDDHLAVALGQAGVFFEHQGVVVGKKSAPLGRASRQCQKHGGHKTGLFLDFEHFRADVVGQVFEFGERVTGHGFTPGLGL